MTEEKENERIKLLKDLEEKKKEQETEILEQKVQFQNKIKIFEDKIGKKEEQAQKINTELKKKEQQMIMKNYESLFPLTGANQRKDSREYSDLFNLLSTFGINIGENATYKNMRASYIDLIKSNQNFISHVEESLKKPYVITHSPIEGIREYKNIDDKDEQKKAADKTSSIIIKGAYEKRTRDNDKIIMREYVNDIISAFTGLTADKIQNLKTQQVNRIFKKIDKNQLYDYYNKTIYKNLPTAEVEYFANKKEKEKEEEEEEEEQEEEDKEEKKDEPKIMQESEEEKQQREEAERIIWVREKKEKIRKAKEAAAERVEEEKKQVDLDNPEERRKQTELIKKNIQKLQQSKEKYTDITDAEELENQAILNQQQPEITGDNPLTEKGIINPERVPPGDPVIPQQEPEQQADGKGKNKKGLWTSEINNYMRMVPEFKGAFPVDIIDKIDTNNKNNVTSFIMNTDTSKGPGKHWVAVFMNNNTIEYFDPFGKEPEKIFYKYISSLARKKFGKGNIYQLKINNVKKQNTKSDNCGWISMNFIKDRLKGKTFKDATGFKILEQSAKGEKNAQLLKKMVDDFGYVKI
jgi:hypothetical protein